MRCGPDRQQSPWSPPSAPGGARAGPVAGWSLSGSRSSGVARSYWISPGYRRLVRWVCRRVPFARFGEGGISSPDARRWGRRRGGSAEFRARPVLEGDEGRDVGSCHRDGRPPRGRVFRLGRWRQAVRPTQAKGCRPISSALLSLGTKFSLKKALPCTRDCDLHRLAHMSEYDPARFCPNKPAAGPCYPLSCTLVQGVSCILV